MNDEHFANRKILFFSDETVVQRERDADGEQQVFGRVQLKSGANDTEKTTGYFNSDTQKYGLNSKLIQYHLIEVQ